MVGLSSRSKAGIVFVVLGIAAIAIGLRTTYGRYRVLQPLLRTEAEVIRTLELDCIRDAGKGLTRRHVTDTCYTAVLSYTVAGKSYESARREVSFDRYSVGSRMTVYIDPVRPDRIMDENHWLSLWSSLVGIGGILFFGLGSWMVRDERRSSSRSA